MVMILGALCTTNGCSTCHLDIGFHFIFIITLNWLHLVLQFIKVHWKAGIHFSLKDICASNTNSAEAHAFVWCSYAKLLPRNLAYAWSQHESLCLAAFPVNKVTHWWTSQENLLCIYTENRPLGRKKIIGQTQVMTRMNQMNWVWNNRTGFLFIPGQYPVH